MEIILYLAVAVIALAFAILSIFLIKVLKSTNATLSKTAETIDSVQGQIDGLTKETTILLHKTNVLTDEIQENAAKFSPAFDAVKDTGESLKKLNNSFAKISHSFEKGVESKQGNTVKVANWGSTILGLWEQYRLKKSYTQSVKEDG
ncbi:DUF948 domain-containing protein [Alkalihalobacillus sp. CinArs1]|uniref:DUF948 domain-containing protein n=1 Tax=Alkalihalobacillus sp. CinArs1 TaxID=2995314 RepID=UPI0022DD819D|nr:DUF948 domain-containing protein [Alkalihalobacillus sp. CinArs1]